MIDQIPFECTNGVSPQMMQQIVRVESSGNPFAIGVVGGRLERQPKNLPEALATARSLELNGYNYSIGISQVNRVHFSRLGWKNSLQSGFDVCSNLKAGAGIFKDCYNGAIRAGYSAGENGQGSATRASLSCYYSGSFVRGEKLGYVAKVLGTKAVAVPGAISVTKKAAVSMFD